VFGCGFQGKIVLEIIERTGDWQPVFFVDDVAASPYRGVPVRTRDESVIAEDLTAVILALGNDNREKIALKQELVRFYEAHALQFPAVKDPSAVISPSARIDRGVIVHPGAIIMADTVIGQFSIVSTGTSLDHDTVVEEYANIAPGVVTAGGVHIGHGAFVGTGAVILPQVSIGAFAVVGAGAVVTKDVPPGTTVVGNPARIIRRVP